MEIAFAPDVGFGVLVFFFLTKQEGLRAPTGKYMKNDRCQRELREGTKKGTRKSTRRKLKPGDIQIRD